MSVMSRANVRLGYEVGDGREVLIPVRNMVVTGQTQEAGKTTALEGLIARLGAPALAFVTKRGEGAFSGAHQVAPYFRERADWQFVASVLEAAMGERLKFERAWIMRASKGARTLADVQRNVRTALADKKTRGMSADVYLTLDNYLDIVVPRIASVTFAPKLDLKRGLNVLDLSDPATFPHELQALVMRSALEWILEKLSGVIAIIPEAWEFIPQTRGSPVKHTAVQLVRKGSGLANYVWLDSQDIAGVDKELLRQCPVWLLGVQREANEIKRVLASIPAGIAKPKAADIAHLERGEFFACFGRTVIKTYAQPAWMSEDDARHWAVGDLVGADRIAMETRTTARRDGDEPLPGDIDLDDAEDTDHAALLAVADEIDEQEDDDMTPEQERKLDRAIELLSSPEVRREANYGSGEPREPQTRVLAETPDFDELYQRFKARLAKEAPALIRVLTVKPELTVVETKQEIELDGKTLRGRLARMIAAGFFDDAKAGNAAFNELHRVGFRTAKPNVYRECDALAELGFLTKEPAGYRAVEGMKRSIKSAA